MERTGSREPEKVKVFIQDAYDELESLIPEKTTSVKYNVVANTKFYALPTGYIKILGVYSRYDTEGRYVRIGRVVNKDLLD